MRIIAKSAATVEKPKPKFALRIGKKKEPTIGAPYSSWSEPFRKLVIEALELHRRCEVLQKPGAQKLSRAAFLRETLKVEPSASIVDVQALQATLNDPSDLTLSFSRSALRRMVKELRGGNLRTPPTAARWDERAKALFLQPRADLVIAELARVNATPLQLFCVAVLEAPAEVFGNADGEQQDIDDHISAAVTKRDTLFELVGRRWTADDLDAGSYSQGRTSAARFKNTPVEVAPTSTAGLRLCQYLASQQQLVEFLEKQRREKSKAVK